MKCPRMIVTAAETNTKSLPKINLPKVKSPKSISTPGIKGTGASLGSNSLKSMRSVISSPKIDSKSIFKKDKLDI